MKFQTEILYMLISFSHSISYLAQLINSNITQSILQQFIHKDIMQNFIKCKAHCRQLFPLVSQPRILSRGCGEAVKNVSYLLNAYLVIQ